MDLGPLGKLLAYLIKTLNIALYPMNMIPLKESSLKLNLVLLSINIF